MDSIIYSAQSLPDTAHKPLPNALPNTLLGSLHKQESWNPLTGCTKASPGCLNCYAERIAKRLQLLGNLKYKNGFNLTLHDYLIERPLEWRQPRFIFVNSMSDLFHEKVPVTFILKIFATMNKATQHTFMIITKRSERLAKLATQLNWTKNIWIGVTVENKAQRFRIDHLRQVAAYVRFLCCEPLLESLGILDLTGIHWLTAGPEQGAKARLMRPEWLAELKARCQANNIYFMNRKEYGSENCETHSDWVKPQKNKTLKSKIVQKKAIKDEQRLLPGF